MGGTSGIPISFLPRSSCATRPARRTSARWWRGRPTCGQPVSIEDVYNDEASIFPACARSTETGYRSRSFLTVPMMDHEGEMVGVLQLIDAKDPDTGDRRRSRPDQRFIEALASQAAIALTNRELIGQLGELFESFVNLINIGIDEKSPYTAATASACRS